MAIKDVMSELSDVLQKNMAKNKGMSGVYQFELSGEEPLDFYIKLSDGVPEVVEGKADSPSITVSMSGSDFLGLKNGTLNAMSAFMGGKLKVKGDMSLAMKLESLIK
ncbi:MAG: SCP2 sterol-binding domain-containing protein [Bacillota bacterium]